MEPGSSIPATKVELTVSARYVKCCFMLGVITILCLIGRMTVKSVSASNDKAKKKKDCLLVLHNFSGKGSVGRGFFLLFFLLLIFHTKSRSVGRENFLTTFYFLKTFSVGRQNMVGQSRTRKQSFFVVA